MQYAGTIEHGALDFILPYRKTQSRFYSGSISDDAFDASQQTVNIQNGYKL